MTKIDAESTAATLTSSAENSRSPTWNEVSAWRSLRPTAIFPNSVSEPVDTTSARPDPWWTTVPMKAHEARFTAESLGVASAVFAAGIDSPVSMASSHSS